MVATEPLTSTDRHKLLHYLHGSIPLRKQRLLAVAWCRRIAHLIPEDIGRTALEVAAQLAEGRPVAVDVERLADHLNYRAFSYIDGFRKERELNIASDALYAVYYALQANFKLTPGFRRRERTTAPFTGLPGALASAVAQAMHARRPVNGPPGAA